MGKRELGQLQPFEFVIAIMMADLATIPMGDIGVPLFEGIIPILILLVAHLTISLLILKSTTIRNIICGEPVIIISKGKVLEKNMRKLRYNFNDLIEQLHNDGIISIYDVEYAILETSGKLTVIPKAENTPVTPKDLLLDVDEVNQTYNIVLDGKIMNKELEKSNYTSEKLLDELKQRNINSVKEVFFACCTEDYLYVQKKGVTDNNENND
jgi:uncharacterized membrane protein YcaP (DUF421 family)